MAFALDDFALVELKGGDRKDWLQGQASNDVRTLQPGGGLSFCFCEPTGQILAIVDAWEIEDRIVMSVARDRVAAVLERIDRMTIMEDLIARELPLRGLWVSAPMSNEDAELILPSARIVEPGWDVWATETDIEKFKSTFETVDAEALRLAAGVPKWGSDATPRTLPPELGPNFEASHVSYAKGCYTGQEVLMRMHTRGHTNRTWVGLIANEALRTGAAVLFGGREVGKISSASLSALSSGIYVAAGTLRNEAVADGEKVEVDGVEAEVRSMPILRSA